MPVYPKTLASTTALIIAAATTAQADQFIVRLTEPLPQLSEGLLEALKIEVVESFEHRGVSFAVLEARDEPYVEALIFARKLNVIQVFSLPVDWSSRPMAALDTDARLRFGTPLACGLCSS